MFDLEALAEYALPNTPSRAEDRLDRLDKLAQAKKQAPTENSQTIKTPQFVAFADYPEENVNPNDETEEWEIDTSWMAIRQKCVFKWWLQQVGLDSDLDWYIKSIWRNDDMIDFADEPSIETDTSKSSTKKVYPKDPNDSYWQELVAGILETADINTASFDRHRESRENSASELLEKSPSPEHSISPKSTIDSGYRTEETPMPQKRSIEDPESGDNTARKLLKVHDGPFSQVPNSPSKSATHAQEVQKESHGRKRSPRYRLRGYKSPEHVRRNSSVSTLPLLTADDQLSSHSYDAQDEVSDEDEDEDESFTGDQELRNDDSKQLRSGKVINITPSKTETMNPQKSSTPEPTPTKNKSPAWKKFLTPVKSPKLQTQRSGQKSLFDGNIFFSGIGKRSTEVHSPVFGNAPLHNIRESSKRLLNENTPVNETGEESAEIDSPFFGIAPFISKKETIKRSKTPDYPYPEESSSDSYFYDPLRLAHPKTSDPNIIYRHVKVPPERRIPQITCYYLDRPFSMDCQWVDGEGLHDQNWNLKTIPFGEVDQKKGLMTEELGLFGSDWRSRLNGDNVELKTHRYYAAPLSESPWFERISCPLYVSARRSLYPSHGFRIWRLDSYQLHDLACAGLLSSTRYAYWKGIFESIEYFRRLEFIEHPLPRPDRALDPETLLPDETPMMEINALAKALWEFDKSLRIFMRAAILWRQQNSNEVSDSNFWVESPFFNPEIAMYLAHFIWYRTRLPVYFFDVGNNWPPADNSSHLKFRINFLHPEGLARAYDEGFDSILLIWAWMFGPDDDDPEDTSLSDWVDEFHDNRRWSNPPYTSYAFNVAWPWFHNLREWDNSPMIEPGQTDDLGDLQSHSSLSLDE